MYKLIYARSFSLNLEKLIDEWINEHGFPITKIKKFIQAIDYSLKSVGKFPEMYQEVSQLYGFSVPTYRILIGKQYAIFYRINHTRKEILIGTIFSQKQMKLLF